MPIFFPTPYPDEILYSVIARYHLMSGNLHSSETKMDIFGKSKINIDMELPYRLSYLSRGLQQGSTITSDKLIRDHTMFGYYFPFLSEEKAKIMYEFLNEGDTTNVRRRNFFKARVSSPEYLRYCTQCYTEDKERYGEAYWHRTHQVSGVNVCHIHEKWLVDSPIKVSSLRYSFRVLNDIINSNNIEYNNKFDDDLSKYVIFARKINKLLTHKFSPFTNEEILERYRYYLSEKGFVTVKGNIRINSLEESMIEFYGEHFLSVFDSKLEKKSWTWIKNFLKKASYLHPLRHLLLLYFLGIDVEKFFNSKLEIEIPFGNGPWKCFNSVCADYNQPVIHNIQIKRSSNKKKRIIGIFECKCRFRYSKSLIDFNPDIIGKVLYRGDLWVETLYLLYIKEKKTVKEIALILKVSTTTINRYINKITPNEANKKKTLKDSKLDALYEKRENYRTEWLNKTIIHPDKGKTKLREMLPSQYEWLIVNDREWLDNNTPKVPRAIVDWKRRDKELTKAVTNTFNRLNNLEGKPIWISKNKILSELGVVDTFKNNRLELPLTEETLEVLVESIDDYRIRRVKWEAKQLFEKQENFTVSQLIKACNFKKHVSIKVREAIEIEFEKYSLENNNFL